MYIDLLLQITRHVMTLRVLRKYTSSIIFFLAASSTAILLNIYAAGKSSPTTCWIMNVDEQINYVTLTLFSAPLGFFGASGFIIVRFAHKKIINMPNSQLRMTLEKHLADSRYTLVLLLCMLVISLSLIVVIPLINSQLNNNYIDASWPVWFTFYSSIRSIFSFINYVESKYITSAFSFNCMIRTRNKKGNWCAH